MDGWVSLEISASDQRARVPTLSIKIPCTAEGLPAIEEAIFVSIPVNLTLLFSRRQYLAAAGAYMRGVERRRSISQRWCATRSRPHLWCVSGAAIWPLPSAR